MGKDRSLKTDRPAKPRAARPARRSRRGLSVLETVFALVLAGTVTAGAVSVYRYFAGAAASDGQAQLGKQAVRWLLNSYRGNIQLDGAGGCPPPAELEVVLAGEFPGGPDGAPADRNGDRMRAMAECIEGPPFYGGRRTVIFRVLVVSDDGDPAGSAWRAVPGYGGAYGRIAEASARLDLIDGKIVPVSRGGASGLMTQLGDEVFRGVDFTAYAGEIAAVGEEWLTTAQFGTGIHARFPPPAPPDEELRPGVLVRRCPAAFPGGIWPVCYDHREDAPVIETRDGTCPAGETGTVVETRRTTVLRVVYQDGRPGQALPPRITDWYETSNTCAPEAPEAPETCQERFWRLWPHGRTIGQGEGQRTQGVTEYCTGGWRQDGGGEGGDNDGGGGDSTGAPGDDGPDMAGDAGDPGVEGGDDGDAGATGGNEGESGDGDGSDGGSGDCYLTTAVVERRGGADDGPVLTALREFRDGWLAAHPRGPALIADYYRTAPGIVAAIPPGHAAWDWIADQVDRAVAEIGAGRPAAALATYEAMVARLARDWGGEAPGSTTGMKTTGEGDDR